MSECDICKGCKCGEVALLKKEIQRMRLELKLVSSHINYLLEDMSEVKKCR